MAEEGRCLEVAFVSGDARVYHMFHVSRPTIQDSVDVSAPLQRRNQQCSTMYTSYFSSCFNTIPNNAVKNISSNYPMQPPNRHPETPPTFHKLPPRPPHASMYPDVTFKSYAHDPRCVVCHCVEVPGDSVCAKHRARFAAPSTYMSLPAISIRPSHIPGQVHVHDCFRLPLVITFRRPIRNPQTTPRWWRVVIIDHHTAAPVHGR